MYWRDPITGETVFRQKLKLPARRVFLAGRSEAGIWRVRMRLEAGWWTARLLLSPGWFFYSFEADGRAFWDADAGKLKLASGRPCSLAVIEGGLVTRGSFGRAGAPGFSPTPRLP